MPFRDPTPVFHLTDVQNLPAIIEAGRLLCHHALFQRGLSYRDASDSRVQDRRSMVTVPVPPGGNLHDYVPLYFGARSPMLGAISQGVVPGYAGTQDDIVYLVAYAQRVAAERRFVFTSGHAVMALSWPFRTDLAELPALPWEKIDATYWFDDPERGYIDRKRPKQAEFLVHEDLPWYLVQHIAVKTDAMKTRVEDVLTGSNHQPLVHVRHDMYY